MYSFIIFFHYWLACRVICTLPYYYYCNVQNYRLLLWSDNFENLFYNACPSYEVKNVGRDRRLAFQFHGVRATHLCSAYTIYGNSGQLGRAIYQNPRKSLRSSKGLYLNSHPSDTDSFENQPQRIHVSLACIRLLINITGVVLERRRTY